MDDFVPAIIEKIAFEHPHVICLNNVARGRSLCYAELMLLVEAISEALQSLLASTSGDHVSSLGAPAVLLCGLDGANLAIAGASRRYVLWGIGPTCY
jgi:hypothetical protein